MFYQKLKKRAQELETQAGIDKVLITEARIEINELNVRNKQLTATMDENAEIYNQWIEDRKTEREQLEVETDRLKSELTAIKLKLSDALAAKELHEKTVKELKTEFANRFGKTDMIVGNVVYPVVKPKRTTIAKVLKNKELPHRLLKALKNVKDTGVKYIDQVKEDDIKNIVGCGLGTVIDFRKLQVMIGNSENIR